MVISEDEKRVWDVIATGFSIVALLAGGFFAAYQKVDADKRELIERTLTYHAKLSEPPILEHRLRLEAEYEAISPKVIPLLENKAGHTQQQVAQDYANLITNKVKSSPKLRESLLVIEEYLDSVVVCVHSGLCDETTAKALIVEFGQSFFRQYYPYICWRRMQWNDKTIAARIEDFFNPNSKGTTCFSEDERR
ncbi:DUF4760 domain-containing protein [Methylolobus aquaticus]